MELIKEKYKQTDIGLIPSDWEVKKIGEVLKVIGGGAFKSIDSTDIGVRWLKIANVGINQILWNDESFLPINFAGENKSFLLKEGDYVLALTRPLLDRKLKISKLKKQDVPALLNQRVGKIQVEENNDADFLYFVFQKHDVINGLLQSMAGTDPPNLGNRGIYNIDFAFPPTKTEQTLIATALSDADTYITSLEKLITKKRNIKQGAMQKLLQPKEGWEVKKLGDVVNIRKGQLITENTRINGNIPVIAGGKTPAYFHNKANRFGKTITISGSGASAGYVAFHKNPIFASDCSTIEESNEYCIEFIYSLLLLFQERIFQKQTGGAQPHIHPSDLNPIEIPFSSIKEQTHIATILLNMDIEIEGIEKKLEKVKMVKQGMMQQLLTGKIRLV